MDLRTISIYIACIIGFFIVGRIFIVPIKIILKLILNSLLGALLLYIINIVGTSFGFHIGLNLITTLITGLLGIPGVILLILLQMFILWYILTLIFFNGILILRNTNEGIKWGN